MVFVKNGASPRGVKSKYSSPTCDRGLGGDDCQYCNNDFIPSHATKSPPMAFVIPSDPMMPNTQQLQESQALGTQCRKV